jgi:hypothetical protein
VPRGKRQVGRLFMTVLGAGFTGWIWYTALFRGHLYRKASMILPSVFVLGLGIIILPGYHPINGKGSIERELKGLTLYLTHWVLTSGASSAR